MPYRHRECNISARLKIKNYYMVMQRWRLNEGQEHNLLKPVWSTPSLRYIHLWVRGFDAELRMGKRINAFEINCIHRLLRIHDTSHTSNKHIRVLVFSYIGKQKAWVPDIMVIRSQLSWFGHVIRRKEMNSLWNTKVQEEADSYRKRGRPVRTRLHNIRHWSAPYPNSWKR